MSESDVFVALTQSEMAHLCKTAHRRIVLAAPGISLSVAQQIAEASHRVGTIRIILDCQDETLRLGYGDIQAVRLLINAGIEVGQSSGLRTGVFIADRQGWSFSPTPLSVERERQSNATPNAIRLNPEQQNTLIEALGLHLHPENAVLPFDDAPVELRYSPLSHAEVARVEKSLAEAPPIPFDLQRQVRVFQPYIQYVELSLQGASLRRQTITLPPSLAPLATAKQVQDRLHTTYSLISDSSKINDKPLHDELNKIRKEFTHTIKSLDGNVMLRGKQSALEARMKVLQSQVDTYKATLEKKLEKEIASSLSQLKRALLPLVLRNPPTELVNGCLGVKPTREEADRWLQYELEKVFPKTETILRDIELKQTFKDVTYSSLNHPDLKKELKDAFPAIEWDKPFEEYAAARATEASPK